MSCWLLVIYTKPIEIAKCRQWDLQSQSNVVLLARSLSCGVNRASSLLGPSEFHHTLAAALDSEILECGRGQSVCRSDRRPETRQQTCGFPTCRLQRFTYTHTHTLQNTNCVSNRDRMRRQQTGHASKCVDCYWYYCYYLATAYCYCYYCLLLPTVT
jgi:hypothetical protein